MALMVLFDKYLYTFFYIKSNIIFMYDKLYSFSYATM